MNLPKPSKNESYLSKINTIVNPRGNKAPLFSTPGNKRNRHISPLYQGEMWRL